MKLGHEIIITSRKKNESFQSDYFGSFEYQLKNFLKNVIKVNDQTLMAHFTTEKVTVLSNPKIYLSFWGI